MKFILKYSPKFLKDIDSKLRINYPWLWATGIHLNLYVGFIIISIFSLIGFAIKVDCNSVPSETFFGQIFVLFLIPAIAWFIYLLKQLSLFNVDKLHGIQSKYREFYVFIIYFITLALPMCIPLSTCLILDSRVRNVVSDNEFYKDCIYYNKGICFFPFEDDNRYDNSKVLYSYFTSDSSYIHYYKNKNNRNYESESYNEVLRDFIFYQRGVFKFNRPHLYFDESYESFYMYSIRDINEQSIYQFQFNQNIRRDSIVAKQEIENFSGLLSKYSNNHFINKESVFNDYYANNYSESFTYKHLSKDIIDIKTNMENIGQSKDWHRFFHHYNFWLALFIFLFYATILFSIFKQVVWKQFILGLSLIAILLTLLGIFQAIFQNYTIFLNGIMTLTCLLLIYFVVRFKTQKYNVVINQACILLNIIFPILGIIVLAFIIKTFNIYQSSYFDKYKTYEKLSNGSIDVRYSPEYYALINTIWQYTFWIGILAYIFVWNSLLKKLYLRLWNLPKHI